MLAGGHCIGHFGNEGLERRQSKLEEVGVDKGRHISPSCFWKFRHAAAKWQPLATSTLESECYWLFSATALRFSTFQSSSLEAWPGRFWTNNGIFKSFSRNGYSLIDQISSILPISTVWSHVTASSQHCPGISTPSNHCSVESPILTIASVKKLCNRASTSNSDKWRWPNQLVGP